MNLLTAFDKFKDSMTAATACAVAAEAAREVFGADVQIDTAPLTDGGEGFCSILTKAAGGRIDHHSVCGPLGEDLEAPLGWVDSGALPGSVRPFIGNTSGPLAVIEMAAAAGLEQVPHTQRHPKHCTTHGVGQLIRIAAESGANAILLGIGGSATSDLGLGALEALGLQFSETTRITPQQWRTVAEIHGSIAVPVPPIYIACDVDNPLLGPCGAAAVYGPQKGLLAEELPAFDREAERLADLLCDYFKKDRSLKNVPGSGAAGGIGFALKVTLGAQHVAGFDLVRAWLDLDGKVAAADLILSGEGKIDRSSLSGKGPYALAMAAHEAGKLCILMAGKVEPDAAEAIRKNFPNCEAHSITPHSCPLPEALANGASNLRTTAAIVLRKHFPQ